MERFRRVSFVSVLTICFCLLAGPPARALPAIPTCSTLADCLDKGRAALFDNGNPPSYLDIWRASHLFKQAVDRAALTTGITRLDHQANMFYAVTRLAAFALENGDPETIETLRDLLEAFGFTYSDLALDDLLNRLLNEGPPCIPPADLPEDSPTADQVMAFLVNQFVPELAAAAANLETIRDTADSTEYVEGTADYITHLTTAETGQTYDLEVDLGEVLAGEALLHAVRGMILAASLTGTDTVDIDGLQNQDFLFLELLQEYENLLGLAAGADQTAAAARDALLAAIDSLQASLAYIESETDNQDDDLLTLDPDVEDLQAFFEKAVSEVEGSLTTGQPAQLGFIQEEWRLTNADGSVLYVEIEKDLDGNFIDGEYWSPEGDNGFLHSWWGWVESYSHDSPLEIRTACSDDPAYPCQAVLNGTLDPEEEWISGGSYSYQSGDRSGSELPFTGVLVDRDEITIPVNFGEALTDPISLREHLPMLTHDPYSGDLLTGGLSSLPDPTFSGILPAGLPETQGIDRVFAWGGTLPDHSPMGMLICRVSGIPPWEISSLTAVFPDGTIADFDPGSNPVHYYQNGALYLLTGQGFSPPAGNYTFVLRTTDGEEYTADKEYTPNGLDPVNMDDGQVEPDGNSYLNTTTPAFSWPAIDPPGQAVTLYYSVRIWDWNRRIIIYDSPRTTDTTARVPADVLQPDTPYQWQVRVFDGPNGMAANNVSLSRSKGFSTGAPDQQLVINTAYVRSRRDPGTPESDTTQLDLRFKGPAPWDVASIQVVGPDDFHYGYQITDLRHPGAFLHHHAAGILADGLYTFTVTTGDGWHQGAVQVQAQRQFIDEPLPVPPPESFYSVPYLGTIHTTTPTFAWLPQESDGPLYYALRIRDWLGNVLYRSPLSTETFHILPAGILLPDSPYTWRVEVYDAETEARNRSDSGSRPFFVAGDGQTAAVSGTIDPGDSGYTAGGIIYIGVFSDPDMAPDHIVSYTALSDTGAFTVSNLPVGVPLYLGCRWDRDGSGDLTPGDWTGAYDANPLQLDAGGADKLAMTLVRETGAEQMLPGQSWAMGGVTHFTFTDPDQGPADGWDTNLSTVTYNRDHTATVTFHRNIAGTDQEGTTWFRYAVVPNPDGTLTIWSAPEGSDRATPIRVAVSDNGNMLVVDGTRPAASPQVDAMQHLGLGVRLNPDRYYGPHDLAGEFYGIGYEFEAPDAYRAWSSITTFDGAGGGLVDPSVLNENNVITTPPAEDRSPIVVEPDGKYADAHGYSGYLTGHEPGDLVTGASPGADKTWAGWFLMRRGDREYDTADLAGTWVLAGFGDESGAHFLARFGSLTCDALGNCRLAMKIRRDNGISHWSGEGTPEGVPLTVAADGSFAPQALTGAPPYTGALGNNGNTILLNTSFDNGNPDHDIRNVYVGVRCDECRNPAGIPYGDVNGDGEVDLADALLINRLLAGLSDSGLNLHADVDNDGRLGLPEGIFALENEAGLRQDGDWSLIDRSYAGGTYDYDPGGGTLTLETTISGFLCDGPPAGTVQFTVNSLDADTVELQEPDGGTMTWQRVSPGTEPPDITGTWYNHDEDGRWWFTFREDNSFSLFGRTDAQCGAEYSVWSGTERVQNSAGVTERDILHFHLWAPQGTVTGIEVTGPGIDGTLNLTTSYPETRDGVEVDNFSADVYPDDNPQAGDTYTFTINGTDGGQEVRSQTLQEAIAGAPQITAPDGYTLDHAATGSTLNVAWTLPDGAITAEELYLGGEVCNNNDEHCQYVDGSITGPTGGTIVLPDLAGPTSAFVDLRVHHNEDVFMNCRHEFLPQ